jgi:putative protease
MRREAADALVFAGREPTGIEFSPSKSDKNEKKLNTALFLKADLLTKVYKSASEYFDAVFVPLLDFEALSGKANGVYIPPIVTDSEREHIKEKLALAADLGAKYALVGNIGHIKLIEGLSLIPIGDFRLNITNTLARAAYSALGIKSAQVSAEMTLPMARDIGGGAIVYGRIPLMLTERCFTREVADCRACGRAALRDRRGVSFPMMREYPHRNLILNSLPTYLADRPEITREAGRPTEAYLFTNEKEKEAAAVIAAAKERASLPYPVRRLPR